MRHVFLSYCRADSAHMHRLRDELIAARIPTWSNENLIPGSPSWQNAIEYAIADALCAVILLSPEAKRSEWVKIETAYALAQNVTLYPVLVAGDRSDAIPITLARHPITDLRDAATYSTESRQLINCLRRHRPVNSTPDRRTDAKRSTQEELAIRLKERAAGPGDLTPLTVSVIATPTPPRQGQPVRYLVTLENTGLHQITDLEASYELTAFPEDSRQLSGLLKGRCVLGTHTLNPGETTSGEIQKPAEDQQAAYIVRIQVEGIAAGLRVRIRATGEAVVLKIEPH